MSRDLNDEPLFGNPFTPGFDAELNAWLDGIKFIPIPAGMRGENEPLFDYLERWLSDANNRVEAFKLCGTCQHQDCFQVAVISDPSTSLSYCRAHYAAMRDALAWSQFNSYGYKYGADCD